MNKRIFSISIYFFFFIHLSFCYSQNVEIDSLITVLKTTQEDTSKVKILNNLFLQFEFSDDEKAKEYLNKALELSQNIGYKKGLAITYTYQGFFADDKSDYSKAIKNYLTALKIYLTINDKRGVADSYNNIGIVYRTLGNYSESIKNHFAALKIRETICDQKGIAASYNNIAGIYQRQGNFQEALKNYFYSLKIKEASGNKKEISNTYLNIGTTYFSKGNYSEALKYYFACLEIKEEVDDKKGIAASYSGIGNIYYTYGDYNEALKNYLICLKIYNSISSKAGIIQSYINIGSVYTKQKKYTIAEKCFLKSKIMAEKIGHKEYLREIHLSLTALDSIRRNYKGAYENHKLYILYRDSIDNEETRKKTIQTQMTYDFEKKEAVSTAEHKKELENQEALAEEKSRKQKAVIGFVGFGLLLVLVLAGFIFRSLRVTRKQKVLIEEQKEIVEHQKHLVEEHQKEIVDSITYAKRIQYTLLANKKLLDDNLSSPWGGAEGGGGYFVLFKPKDIVSGDFYWATKKTDSRQSTEGKEEKTERFYIAACDSTGHGVPGAFMSLLNISFLNEAVNEKNILEPHEILNHVRKRLIENMDGGQDGMDCILLCIESSPLSFGEGAGVRCTYAAANNSPTIIKNGKLISLEADKMPVGKGEKGKSFTLRTINLTPSPGERQKPYGLLSETVRQNERTLYLYTDGYADQFGGPKGKKFKYKQLDELLVSIVDKPCKEQSEMLNQKFEEWKGNLEQVDDVLVIGIRI